MRKLILTIMAVISVMTGFASTSKPMTATEEKKVQKNDSTIFRGRLENKEYQVFIVMNFYKNNIKCPGNEIFGEIPGYFGAHRDPRKWIIEDATVSGNKAKLVIINDYGSEDLDAKLYRNKDGSYTLERVSGSTMKIVVNRKWVKIPKKIDFKKVY